MIGPGRNIYQQPKSTKLGKRSAPRSQIPAIGREKRKPEVDTDIQAEGERRWRERERERE